MSLKITCASRAVVSKGDEPFGNAVGSGPS